MEAKKRIGDYEILDELGSGGMGRVFRVRNVISDRVEAMKVLLPDLVGRQDLAARFLREIKVLAALNHPNIAALRTALTADNQLVMIMEYVEGQSVARSPGAGAHRNCRRHQVHRPGARCVELRARAACGSSRHQASQHDADPERGREGHGLWDRPDGRAIKRSPLRGRRPGR